MKLNDYLKSHKISQSKFARLLNVSERTIWRYCNGNHPSRKKAEQIVAATKGKVTLKDLLL